MDRIERRSIPGWFAATLAAALLFMGSSFNCVCWGEDDQDWCEEHDCDDDAEGSDDDDVSDDDDDDHIKDKPPTDDDTGDDDDDTKPPTDDDTGDDDDDITQGDDDDTTPGDDDDTTQGDDDDTTQGDDDDDTLGDDDDTLGDDDDTVALYDCNDYCADEQGICIDWTGSGMTCMDFCLGCLTPDALLCLSTCPVPHWTDSCACVHNCLSPWLVP